jgi:hypothetical protein
MSKLKGGEEAYWYGYGDSFPELGPDHENEKSPFFWLRKIGANLG